MQEKEKYQYDLYAYVLMDNHVHLLIGDREDMLSSIMQSLTISYALYFNKKYKRIGHVFYNRFKSKEVETLSYFLNLIRYIHFNPEKSGVCEYNKYNWSSYRQYNSISEFVNSSKVLKMAEMNIEDFKNFHQEYQQKRGYIVEELEMEKCHIDDETAIKKLQETLQVKNLASIVNFDKEKRNAMILQAIAIDGMERKQLARILGTNEKMIYRISKKRINIKVSDKLTSPIGQKENQMAKTKTVFVCSQCGYESTKWLGKCPGCNEWNSFYEEKLAKDSRKWH